MKARLVEKLIRLNGCGWKSDEYAIRKVIEVMLKPMKKLREKILSVQHGQESSDETRGT